MLRPPFFMSSRTSSIWESLKDPEVVKRSGKFMNYLHEIRSRVSLEQKGDVGMDASLLSRSLSPTNWYDMTTI